MFVVGHTHRPTLERVSRHGHVVNGGSIGGGGTGNLADEARPTSASPGSATRSPAASSRSPPTWSGSTPATAPRPRARERLDEPLPG